MTQKHNHKKNKNIHEFQVDDIISVLIPKVDSGHTDFPRLVGKILNVNNQHANAHPSFRTKSFVRVLKPRILVKSLPNGIYFSLKGNLALIKWPISRPGLRFSIIQNNMLPIKKDEWAVRGKTYEFKFCGKSETCYVICSGPEKIHYVLIGDLLTHIQTLVKSCEDYGKIHHN